MKFIQSSRSRRISRRKKEKVEAAAAVRLTGCFGITWHTHGFTFYDGWVLTIFLT